MTRTSLRKRLGSALPPRQSFDLAPALVLTVIGQLEAWFGETVTPSWLHAGIALVITGSLAWRRRAPLVVLSLVVAGVVAVDATAQLSLFAATVIASYTTGSELEDRRSLAGLAIAVVPFWAIFTVIGSAPSDFVAIAVLYGGAWGAGRLVRERNRRADELAGRMVQLEEERDELTATALADERARIARELHDIVSHSISVIAIQSQAVRRRLGPDQEREADDLRGMESAAREAMAEMRRLFGVLRADGAPAALTPQPGLDRLDPLIERGRAAGLEVELRVTGEPVPLPAGVDLTAYRIIQEALTNIRKHAGAAHASVEIQYGNRDLELLIEDDGSHGSRSEDGVGHGLIGMKERALIYGGRFEAGPREGDGFRVLAVLPYEEAGR
ncbi:histidine kinase [soil metagenome]